MNKITEDQVILAQLHRDSQEAKALSLPAVPAPQQGEASLEDEQDQWIASVVRGIRLDNEAQAALLGMTLADFESADDLVIVKKLLAAGWKQGHEAGARREREESFSREEYFRLQTVATDLIKVRDQLRSDLALAREALENAKGLAVNIQCTCQSDFEASAADKGLSLCRRCKLVARLTTKEGNNE